MCLYPKLIINRKYIPNKKNGYNAPAIRDPRTLYVPIGCQKCMECKKQKGRAWSLRLQEEIRETKHGQFVTLTFSNESIQKIRKEIEILEGYELDNEIATRAVRLFLERWRKKYKKSITHWLITELGHNGTENIHLHGILFLNEYLTPYKKIGTKISLKPFKPKITKDWYKDANKKRTIYLQQQKEDIKKIWSYGYVFIGDYVNEKTVNYCIKYSTKVDLIHTEYNAKILCSPGIGANYTKRRDSELNRYQNKGTTKETYTTRQGRKIALPTYWRNKIYSEEEREQLWLQKLDKEERWVDGSKTSIANDDYTEYYKLLQYARAKNRRLGYGTDEKNWNRLQYENERRRLNYKKRLEKTCVPRGT